MSHNTLQGVWTVPAGQSLPPIDFSKLYNTGEKTVMNNMETSTTIGKISASLLKAQKGMGNATKDAKNPFFKSNYADLNAIREACMPLLNENGITVLQPTITKEGKPYVRTLLLHESGEFLGADTEIICAKANDPQAHGSGISYARRYGLQAFLSVGAQDDDGEAAMGRTKATSYPAKAPAKASEPPLVTLPNGSSTPPAGFVQAAAEVKAAAVTEAVKAAKPSFRKAAPAAPVAPSPSVEESMPEGWE